MKLRHAVVGAISAAAITAVGIGTAPAAFADGTDSTGTILDGRTAASEDGLQSDQGELSVDEMAPMALTKKTRGTTYSQSNHPNWFQYFGEARAMANVYNGRRWIQASFHYRVAGVSKGVKKSNATGCWAPGSTVKQTVLDSLDPNAPQTTWSYGFASVPLGVC
ncbi:hypothetical protein [Kribbella deserti]|uniref:Secreted protein n=1 Tax=Kribbella deserti TaxID=1926257 RepID=A0ABV6QN28_9ACTN